MLFVLVLAFVLVIVVCEKEMAVLVFARSCVIEWVSSEIAV